MSDGTIIPSAATEVTLELAVAAWLHEKRGRTQSARTERAYADTLSSFRMLLARQRPPLDLDRVYERAECQQVTLCAQAWAAHASAGRGGRPPAASTVNHRLAVVSSFYTFARRRFWPALPNPVEPVARRPIDGYASAQPLEEARVALLVGAIDRSTLLGLRDYAFLLVAFTTGRRLEELRQLRLGDLALRADGRIGVLWRRTKGGKTQRDVLEPPVVEALLAYIRALTARTGDINGGDAPIWRACDERRRIDARGSVLSRGAIVQLCRRRLGITKVHVTRHTFARAMLTAGARVDELQAQLGHSNLATTSSYVKTLGAEVNPHAQRVTALLLGTPDSTTAGE